jgi:hypothetical protein
VLASVAVMVFAVALQRRLVARFGDWNATLLAAGVYILAMAVCYAVFPTINEVPQEELPNVVAAVTHANVTFPPTVLWSFRVASLGLQAVVWATIALTFGFLAERLLERPAHAAVRERAPVEASVN